MATKKPASAYFKTQMALVFKGTAVNIVATVLLPGFAIGRAVGRAAAYAILPTRWLPQILVYLEGVERALSWFQDLPPNYFYVLAHGDSDGPVKPPRPEVRHIAVFEQLPVDELAAAITGHKYYVKGRPVVLISCQVGAGSFPGKLADKIKADVYATPDYLNIFLITTPGRTSLPRLNWWVWTP